MPSRLIETTIRLHVENLFEFYYKAKLGNFKEFKEIRNIFREAGVELCNPIDKSAVEICIPISALKELFEDQIYAIFDDAGTESESLSDEEGYTDNQSLMNNIIKGITNEDLENFRLKILQLYKIKYCNCGCTVVSMDTDEIQAPMSQDKLDQIHKTAATMICEM